MKKLTKTQLAMIEYSAVVGLDQPRKMKAATELQAAGFGTLEIVTNDYGYKYGRFHPNYDTTDENGNRVSSALLAYRASKAGVTK